MKRATSVLLIASAAFGSGTLPASAQPSQPIAQIAGPERFLNHLISMAYGEGGLWLSCHTRSELWFNQEGRTYRIDPRTHETVATLPCSGQLAVGEGAVWILAGGKQENLHKIDPRTNQVVASLPVERGLVGQMAVGEGGVWLGGLGGQKIVRVDPQTLQVIATIPLDHPLVHYATSSIAAGEGSIWLLCSWAHTGLAKHYVVRIDPRTNQIVATIPVAMSTHLIAVGEGRVWAVEGSPGFVGSPDVTVTQINPLTNQVAEKPAALHQGYVARVAVGMGGLWVLESARTNVLSFLDARTGQVKEFPATTTHRLPASLALDGQAIWVGSTAPTGGTVLDRVQP